MGLAGGVGDGHTIREPLVGEGVGDAIKRDGGGTDPEGGDPVFRTGEIGGLLGNAQADGTGIRVDGQIPARNDVDSVHGHLHVITAAAFFPQRFVVVSVARNQAQSLLMGGKRTAATRLRRHEGHIGRIFIGAGIQSGPVIAAQVNGEVVDIRDEQPGDTPPVAFMGVIRISFTAVDGCDVKTIIREVRVVRAGRKISYRVPTDPKIGFHEGKPRRENPAAEGDGAVRHNRIRHPGRVRNIVHDHGVKAALRLPGRGQDHVGLVHNGGGKNREVHTRSVGDGVVRGFPGGRQIQQFIERNGHPVERIIAEGPESQGRRGIRNHRESGVRAGHLAELVFDHGMEQGSIGEAQGAERIGRTGGTGHGHAVAIPLIGEGGRTTRRHREGGIEAFVNGLIDGTGHADRREYDVHTRAAKGIVRGER